MKSGAGCPSASVMSSIVKGKTATAAKLLFEQFRGLVTGANGGAEAFDRLGKLAAFSGVSEFPARVKCAILAWHALNAALEAKAEVVSTE